MTSQKVSHQHKCLGAKWQSKKTLSPVSSVPTAVEIGRGPPTHTFTKGPAAQTRTVVPIRRLGGHSQINMLLLPTEKPPPSHPVSYRKSLSSGSQCVAPIPTQATWKLSRKVHPHSRPRCQTLWGKSSHGRFKASPLRDADAHFRAGEFAHLRSNGPWYSARRGWEEKQGQGCLVILLCDPAQLAFCDPWSSCNHSLHLSQVQGFLLCLADDKGSSGMNQYPSWWFSLDWWFSSKVSQILCPMKV